MTSVLICDINFQADEREQHVLIIIPLQNKPQAQTKEERKEGGGIQERNRITFSRLSN